jgi:hypothetical protein
MGYVALGGYLLIGCGPALVFFGTRVAHRAFLVVLTFTRYVAFLLWVATPGCQIGYTLTHALSVSARPRVQLRDMDPVRVAARASVRT